LQHSLFTQDASMGTEAPTPIVIPVHCAPKKAPCPKCGKTGIRRRKAAPRRVRTVAYKTVAFLEITCGEYRARCDCCTTFRNTPEQVLPRALYDNKVRDLVLGRILDDGMSIEQTLKSLRREYLLDLSTGFVYDVLYDRARGLDLAEHRRMVLEHFSGTLCVDELHPGRFTLLLATDPLADLPVAFALVDKNDSDHMRRFLRNLKTWGLAPEVVVTDGSNLYPAVLGELWPEADHQLCVFHVIKDINKLVLDAVRRLRNAMKRRGQAGRKKKRGRRAAKSKAASRRGMTLKQKSSFVFKHRHLIVQRRENFTEKDGEDLTRMLEYLPELATLRHFADRIYWLFDTPKDRHQAACRRAVILREAAFQAVPELTKALKQLNEEKFPKLMAYLANPVSRRVRTNNHVERTNRMFRLLEKVRYKWRRRRTLVRFAVLTLDGIWKESTAAWSDASVASGVPRSGKTERETRKRGRAA
jgi:transposase-like protein